MNISSGIISSKKFIFIFINLRLNIKIFFEHFDNKKIKRALGRINLI